MNAWIIRPLSQADLPQFRPLRLRALRDHPEAFGSSFEEEEHEDMTRLINQPPSITIGGFINEALVGTAAMIVSPRMKQRHKGHIVAMYVEPGCRRTGLAQGLLDHLIQGARAAGLTMLTLSVTTGNVAARRLYRRAGFTTYGIEPNCLVVDGIAWDAEFMALFCAPPA